MSDAIRDQLIEAMAEALFCGEALEDEDIGIVRRALDAMLALRDSDGIPLVLGLVAEQMTDCCVDHLGRYRHFPPSLHDDRPVFVPRLSEDRPHE